MWLGCPKDGIRLQAGKGGGSGRQDMAIRPGAGLI
jgi:hypothetical protein